jgi:hypothetical protein
MLTEAAHTLSQAAGQSSGKKAASLRKRAEDIRARMVSEQDALIARKGLVVLRSEADGWCLHHSLNTCHQHGHGGHGFDGGAAGLLIQVNDHLQGSAQQYAHGLLTADQVRSQMAEHVATKNFQLLVCDEILMQAISDKLHCRLEIYNLGAAEPTVFTPADGTAADVYRVRRRGEHFDALVTIAQQADQQARMQGLSMSTVTGSSLEAVSANSD